MTSFNDSTFAPLTSDDAAPAQILRPTPGNIFLGALGLTALAAVMVISSTWQQMQNLQTDATKYQKLRANLHMDLDRTHILNARGDAGKAARDAVSEFGMPGADAATVEARVNLIANEKDDFANGHPVKSRLLVFKASWGEGIKEGGDPYSRKEPTDTDTLETLVGTLDRALAEPNAAQYGRL